MLTVAHGTHTGASGPIAIALVGMGIPLLLIPVILRRPDLWPCSRPRDLHHTHARKVPRLGGLALAAALSIVEACIAILSPTGDPDSSTRIVVLCSSLGMFGIGFVDDLRALGAKRKLLLQIIVALSVCCLGLGIQSFRIPFLQLRIELGGWGVALTVLWLVGMTNLINFIDGVDGLAAGISAMLMVLLVFVGDGSGQTGLVAAGMAGALLGFLWFNFPPARIYMGDGGAYLLGHLVGILALVSSRKGEVLVALGAPMIVLALPILDMLLAIFRRGLRGLPVFRADRRHIHHHLLSAGISRKRVVLAMYVVTLVFLGLGFAAFWSRGRLVPISLGVTMLILLICARQLSFSRRWFAVGRTVEDALKMRPDVRYALCATKLLGLEGGRRASVDRLWPELVRTGQKLGFTSIRLRLADGDRIWEERIGCQTKHFIRQALQGGRYGVLELKAPSCRLKEISSQCPQGFDCRRNSCLRIGDENMFEIMSELLAEGWVRAVSHWRNGDPNPLRFDSSFTSATTHSGTLSENYRTYGPGEQTGHLAVQEIQKG